VPDIVGGGGVVPGWMSALETRWSRSAASKPASESELDMRREAQSRPNVLARVLACTGEQLRRLLPTSGMVIGPPTRAVDRDLEDSWPSHRSGF